jgi:hypothetical protein
MLPLGHFKIIVRPAFAHPCVGMGPDAFVIQVTKLVVMFRNVDTLAN